VSLTVCLSFDFDATSLWIASGAGATDVSRGEFGAVAVPRILDMLERAGAPATFFVPGHTAYAYPPLVEAIAAGGHELAPHGWVHESTRDFPKEAERALLEKSLDVLERLSNARPRGHRASSDQLSPHTVEILAELGIEYDASCSGSDFDPYYLRIGDSWSRTEPYRFGDVSPVAEIPFSWVLDDFPQFEFWPGWGHRLASPAEVEALWREEFDHAYERAPDGVFDLCLHPQCIGRWPRLAMLERLIGYMAGHDGVTFRTMLDYALDWKAANPLERWAERNSTFCGRDALPE
jgi:peptidoglycan/xylan/chitin deacetylase (PgdA/CDA1 family)